MKRQRIRRLLTFLSLILFPITMNYLSPVIPLMGATERVIPASIITFLLMLVLSLFFGRLWCGWACPAAGMQDICSTINAKPVRRKWQDILKYIIWVIWLTVMAILFVNATGQITINLLFGSENVVSVDNFYKLIIYYIVVGVFLIISLLVGKRAACHMICWMAPFMIIGSALGRKLKIDRLHIRVQYDRCVQCGRCTKNCPMSLDVQAMVANGNMEHTECVLCGECIDNCNKKTLNYAWHTKR